MKTENDPAYLMMRDLSTGFEALFFKNENGIMLVSVESLLRWFEHGGLMSPHTVIGELSRRSVDAEDEITKRQAAFSNKADKIPTLGECSCFELKTMIVPAPQATQEQILNLWKAVVVTAAVMCLGFCVAFYRLIYG